MVALAANRADKGSEGGPDLRRLHSWVRKGSRRRSLPWDNRPLHSLAGNAEVTTGRVGLNNRVRYRVRYGTPFSVQLDTGWEAMGWAGVKSLLGGH